MLQFVLLCFNFVCMLKLIIYIMSGKKKKILSLFFVKSHVSVTIFYVVISSCLGDSVCTSGTAYPTIMYIVCTEERKL